MRMRTIGSTSAIAPRAATPAQKFISKVNPLRGFEREFILETQGTDFSVGVRQSGSKASSVRYCAPQRLEADAIRKVLSEFGYSGQSLAMILHPPCVCLKVLHLDSGNPEAWLAAHLPDISPPVNRRELVMAYQVSSSHQLLVAFVRRTFLSELKELIQATRISGSGIYVGGAIAFPSNLENEHEDTCTNIDYSLCRYRLQRNGEDCQIFADPGVKISLDYGDHVAKPDIALKHLKKLSIDFRGQAGLPQALSVASLSRVVRAEFYAVMLCACLLLLYWGARAISDDHVSDQDYRTAVLELGSLRQEHASLKVELERTTRVARPSYVAGTLLKNVATAAPEQTILSSISFSRNQNTGACAFSLSGYSRNSSAPLNFADSLRQYPHISSVTLARVGLVDAPAGDFGQAQPATRWTKFEIVGEYAGK